MSKQHTFPASILWVLVVLTLGWGFNWPMIKLALTEIPVLAFRSICLLAGAAGLFGIAMYSRLPLQVPRGQWPRLLLISLFNITGWNLCTVYGIGYMSSGRAAILAFTMPLWGILLSAWLLNEHLTGRRILGVSLGMGALALLMSNEFQAVQAAPKGTLLMMGAALSWAIGTVMMRRYPVDMPSGVLTAWQLFLGGIPIYAGALLLETQRLQPLSVWPAVALAYNILIAFIVCNWAWTKIATTVPVGVSSVSTLMIPVIGVFSGMLVLSEVPHWQDYAALALVIVALGTVLLPPGWIRGLFAEN